MPKTGNEYFGRQRSKFAWLQGIKKNRRKKFIQLVRNLFYDNSANEVLWLVAKQFLLKAFKKRENKMLIQPRKYYGWLRGISKEN